MKRQRYLLLLLFFAAIAIWFWKERNRGAGKEVVVESPLYTGKEAKSTVSLSFPAREKGGFVSEDAEIYLTSSRNAQMKQALLFLFQGPKDPKDGALPAFPPDFKYRELFVTPQGLAVLDLDPASVAAMPGGTSAEFVSLYCLLRCLLDNFKELKAVQILVGGLPQESLDGHMDISGPLTLADL